MGTTIDLIKAARAFLEFFNPHDLPSDQEQQWLALYHAVELAEASDEAKIEQAFASLCSLLDAMELADPSEIRSLLASRFELVRQAGLTVAKFPIDDGVGLKQ